MSETARSVIILGAAGPNYPAALYGTLYPGGIPVFPVTDLAHLIRQHEVNDVVFCYSDVRHLHVMHLASVAFANGAVAYAGVDYAAVLARRADKR